MDKTMTAPPLTCGCCQWRDSGSFDSDAHIETFVLRGKLRSETTTEQQPPNRYVQFENLPFKERRP